MDDTQSMMSIEQLEAQLAEAQQRYALLTESMVDGFFDWDLDAGTVYLSPSWKLQLGYAPDELEGNFETWRDLLHSSDRRRVLADLRAFLDGDDTLWEHDFRLRQQNGSYRWIRARGTGVRDAGGKVRRLIGVHIDIDQLKRATESQLRQQRLLDAIYRAIPDLFFLLDRTGRIIAFHGGEGSRTLVAPEQMIDQPVEGFLPTDLAKQFRQAFDQVIASGAMASYEYPLVVDGEERMFEARLYPGSDGESVSSIVRDVTDSARERHAQAERLKELTGLFRVQQAALGATTLEDFMPHVLGEIHAAMQHPDKVALSLALGSESSSVGAVEVVGQEMRHDVADSTHTFGHLHVAFATDYPPLLDEHHLLEAAASTVTLWIQSRQAQASSATFRQMVAETQEELYRRANEDALTGLPNRSRLMRVLERTIESSRRSLDPFAVMFIDLDRFKDVNDTLGHAAGDRLLQEVALRLRGVLRANDFLARVGGDEFVAVFPGLDSSGNASIIASKMIDVLHAPFDIDGHQAAVGTSIGIASYPSDGEGSELLLRNADTAMYQAKADGRGAWRCYSDDMTQRAAHHLFLVSGLRQAIATAHGLRMVYQPQYDLASGAVSGFEALLRWHHPDAGDISPREFIPAAEESALIRSLDAWVVTRVCEDMAVAGAARFQQTPVSVNVSGASLASPEFAEQVAAALQAQGIDGRWLEFEVSERSMLSKLEQTHVDLSWLTPLGIQLSIDDFGTSYSNLLQLKRMPIQRLKIDGAFIRDLPGQPEGAAVTAAIIALGNSLDLEVIAGGVETADQAQCLSQYAGLKAQGFLYSQPVEAAELATFSH